jgi:hypothetical protein
MTGHNLKSVGTPTLSYTIRVEEMWKLGKLVSGTNICFQEPRDQTSIQVSLKLLDIKSPKDGI